jgi:F-type H+-transporting ATPase subunit b
MNKPILFFLVALFLMGLPVAAQEHVEGEAAEAGAEHAAAEEHESPLAVAFRWVNFAILFGGLGYLLRKPAREFFEGRRNEISSGLQRASQAQETAEARMSEIEKRLSRLSSDITALRGEAEKESAVERAKVIEEAKREVERVVEQSRQEIQRIARTAEREIKEGLADVVIDRASKALRTEMTEDDQKRVIVRFIKKL